MKLGDRIRELREEFGFTQGHLAGNASVSQGYLSQLENGEVKNPSAAVLLRVAQAMRIDPDELFEAAGYSTYGP
jgi:transcriptional regulator with XRE-family HTH domain